MPRHSTQQEDDIVFEDLHGMSGVDETHVEVDLDSDGDSDGISRVSRTSSDDGTATGDDDDFTGTRSPRGSDDDDDDADGREGGDDAGTSSFKKRLQREQRQKRQARKEAAEAKAENERLRKQLAKRDRSKGEDKSAELLSQIESVETDLEEAVEAGDSKKQVRLTSRLTDLKAEQIAAKYTRTDDDDDDLGDSGAGAPQSQGNELVAEWIDKHDDWYNQRGYARQTRIVKRIDQELFKEGYDPGDEEYYDELDARLKEKVPELFDENGDPDPDGMEARKTNRRGTKETRADKRNRSPVASADDASRDSTPRSKDSSKVELVPDDFKNMRKYGLDPGDPKHVREYALNKRQIALEEAANG